MNYSEMTDFEINWRVFELLHGGSPDFKEGENGTMVLVSEECDVQMGEHVTIEAVRGHFNPCNSWADAGPIIEKHMICLAADVFAEPQDGGKWVAQPAYGWDSERVRSDNPLRAAMIVFLMKQEKPDAT